LAAALLLSGCGNDVAGPSARPTAVVTVTETATPSASPSTDSSASAERSAEELILVDLLESGGWLFEEGLGEDFVELCEAFDGKARDSRYIIWARDVWLEGWRETAPAKWRDDGKDIFDTVIDSCYAHGVTQYE